MSNLTENHCSSKLPIAVSGWTISKGFSRKAWLVTLCPEPSQASGGHGRLSADLCWERNYRNKAFCKCWYSNGICISPLSLRKAVLGNRTQISDLYFPLYFTPHHHPLLSPCCWVTSVVSDSVNPIPEILQARTLEWVAISFSNA